MREGGQNLQSEEEGLTIRLTSSMTALPGLNIDRSLLHFTTTDTNYWFDITSRRAEGTMPPSVSVSLAW